MKIKKIAKIHNAFSYAFFDWEKANPCAGQNSNHPDHEFRKSNILFAENGNGKSKIVKIFKSLNGNTITIEKHRDNPSVDQKILIIAEPNIEVCYSGSWVNNCFNNKFHIFDKEFIETYVHDLGSDCNDTPQRKQNRGRNVIYLGDFANYDREIRSINSIKTLISQKNDAFETQRNASVAALLKNLNLGQDELIRRRQVIGALSEAELQSKQEQREKQRKECDEVIKAIQNKQKIAALVKLKEEIPLFSLNTEIQENGKTLAVVLDPKEILSFTVSKGVVAVLQKIGGKKDFINQGVSLLADGDLCPFCEQKVKETDYIQVIKDYQKIFDANFSKEESKERALLDEYKKLLNALKGFSVPSPDQLNAVSLINQFIQIDDGLPTFQITEDNVAVIEKELLLVSKKEKSLLDEIKETNIEAIKLVIDSVNESIDKYNNKAKAINIRLLKLKDDSAKGSLEQRRNEIEASIKKLDIEIICIKNLVTLREFYEDLDKYSENQKVIVSLENIYQVMKDKIVEKFKEFASEYFAVIKSFVKKINPAMEIFEIEEDSTYDRRNPKDPAQCGFTIKYNKINCENGLSEGERQTLALAFFFAQLIKDKDKDKIIVFDDPISSFDAGKRKTIAEIIEKETALFSQLFVFTCDPLFREFCLKQLDVNRNFYYILKTSNSSSIHYAPKSRESIYSSFESDFCNIDSIQGTDENIVIYGQKLRFCLETKIKEKYFGYSTDSLSMMIDIATKNGGAEFKKLIDNKNSILELYSYCNTGGLAHYPRDGATSWSELCCMIKKYESLKL